MFESWDMGAELGQSSSWIDQKVTGSAVKTLPVGNSKYPPFLSDLSPEGENDQKKREREAL